MTACAAAACTLSHRDRVYARGCIAGECDTHSKQSVMDSEQDGMDARGRTEPDWGRFGLSEAQQKETQLERQPETGEHGDYQHHTDAESNELFREEQVSGQWHRMVNKDSYSGHSIKHNTFMYVGVTLEALKYVCINHGDQRVFQFEISINVLTQVGSFRFI